MRRSAILLFCLCLACLLAACGKKTTASVGTGGELAQGELILVVDGVDKPYEQDVWKGVRQVGTDQGVSVARLEVPETTTSARLDTIAQGVTKGAKVVVCAGPAYEEAVFLAQIRYPEVKFLLLDGEPNDGIDPIYETTPNTHCIRYREEQAGYLAGYVAVWDGFRQLGFCGQSDTHGVIREGYGFLQGAEAAAAQLGLTPGEVSVRYWYAGADTDATAIHTKMVEWYTQGTQVVFACGGDVCTQGVIKAAERTGGQMIGADADRYTQSDTVVVSAVKDLARSVELSLQTLYQNQGTWDMEHAGQTANLGVAEGCVKLSDNAASWRLHSSTAEAYGTLLGWLTEGDVIVDASSNREILPPVTLCIVEDQGKGVAIAPVPSEES